ncbi:MAG TPA: acetylxylan esterase [Bryobacteraceae bacterium]|nr:acetylxylan esterase [Bryobacteraceae bacterium]
MIRAALATLLATGSLCAQAPATDARNIDIPHTDFHFSMPKYTSVAQWEAHKAQLKRQILVAAGLYPLPEKTPLHPLIEGRVEHGDYSIEKVALETLPGYYLGGNLYRPLHPKGKVPAILTPHGHWTYGRLENSEGYSGPALGINLARQGYVAFAYDMAGYNDTLQTEHRFSSPTYELWSFTPLGLQLWNSIRALDFVESLPEVDGQRLAVTGASGGGTQTFLLAAVDNRVRAAAPVNMVSFIMQGGCECENAPGLRIGTSNVEIAAMMAPRPLLLVSATGDWTRNVPREEYPAVRSIYQLYQQPDSVQVVQFHAEHNYNRKSREAVYTFFRNQLVGPASGPVEERSVEVEPLLDMLMWQGRNLPANAVNQRQLFEQWKTSGRARAAALDPAARRDLMLAVFHAEWPRDVRSESAGDGVAMSRPGRGDRVPGVWVPGSGPPTLVVDPDGAEAARRNPRVAGLIKAGKPVLIIDVFQSGKAAAPRNPQLKFHLTFNASDDANRVQDILTALRYLDSRHAGKPTLLAIGRAGAWALYAKALAPIDVALQADAGACPSRDEDFVKNLFVPGVQLVAEPCAKQ